MNNLRKVAVMLLIGALALGMVGVVPDRPMAETTSQVATPNHSSPNVSTPQTVMDNWEEYLDESRLEGVLDSVLASYKETGKAPDKVATNVDGDVGVLIVMKDGADVAALEDIVDVNWKADFKVATVVSAYVDSSNTLTELEGLNGVASVFADQLYRETGSDLSAKPDSEQPSGTRPHMYEVKDLVGADYAYGEGYDGEGVRVGVVDTGVDFTHPDLVEAVDIDETGMPTSYDPSGFGLGVTLYRVNATTLDNATAWLEASSWNLLSYEKNGKYYINGTGWDPYVNYQGGLVHLDWFIDAYLAAWWGDAYPNQGNLTEYYYSMMRQDLEIPDPSKTQGNSYPYSWGGGSDSTPYYCAGYVMQQRYTPYAKLFAPALVLNGDMGQKLIIDWNTTIAHSQFWNLNINYGLYDFNNTSTWNYFNGLGDWSFVDDLDEDWWYNTTGGKIDNKHVVVAWDKTGDGSFDFGLGVLAHVWDSVFGTGMVDGIGLGGRFIGIMYDDSSHGTACASIIAGRGELEYPVGLNGTNEKLYGIANKSTVLGISTVGLGTQFGANMWVAGFDYNPSTGYFEWNPDSSHRMDVTSNSWGWIADQNYEFYGFASLVYLALSTPEYFGTDYPGMLYAFSSGNSGPGFATTTPPSAASILHVGASTSGHRWVDAYGPDQNDDQIASFSSRGPLFSGYSKPDVVAPGAYGYALHPYYAPAIFGGLTETTPYQTFGGTSMACPVTVGVVALVTQASAGMAMPSDIKTAIQSSAVDLGYDAFTQGHGRVDAQGAIDYIESSSSNTADGVWWYNTASSSNYAGGVAAAWNYWMDPYAEDILIEDLAPSGHKDSSLFYGWLAPGDTASISVTGLLSDGTEVTTSDFSTIEARQYQMGSVFTDVWTTYIYNESVSTGTPETKAGYFNLTEEMTSAEMTDFQDASYATIVINSDNDTFRDTDNLWSFVFDWNDQNDNDVPDFYNETDDLGDELTRIQFGGSGSNVIKMDLAHPSGIGNLFGNTPIVSIHDETIWEWPQPPGNELNVSIIMWEETSTLDEASFSFGDDTDRPWPFGEPTGIWANLTVGADADPGIHHGVIVFDDGGTYVKKLPYSYHVTKAVDTSNGEEHLVADGYGDVWTPYEHGTAIGLMDLYAGESSGDHFTYLVNVANASAKYLGAKVTWAGADTEFEVAIVGLDGMVMADSADAIKPTDTSSSAIAEIGGTGLYAIFVNTLSIEGDPMPQNFTVNVMCYQEIPKPTLSLYWESRDNPGYQPIAKDGVATGDHVVMNATWTDATLTNMPDYEITSLEMKILKGMLFESTGNDLVIPASGADPFSGTINLDNFGWVEVPNINAGDPVRITVDFTNGDSDVMAWWKDTDNSTWSYDNNLLEDQMATGDKPEKGEFEAQRDGTLMIGVFNYDGQPGTFDVKVDTRVGLEPSRAISKSFEIDTYYLLANGSYSVLVDSDTGTNWQYSLEIPNITINNYFAPVVEEVEVSGSGAEKTINWTVTDLNADDEHFFEVLLSADGGTTYQLLTKNYNETSYVWDSTGFEDLDTYKVQIRAFDNNTLINRTYYELPGGAWPGLEARGYSDTFSAGTEETPTPTTTTTTTPPETTTPVGPGIDPLILGLVAGIGAGVVVVLILFLVKRR